jgi:hypothetical protein
MLLVSMSKCVGYGVSNRTISFVPTSRCEDLRVFVPNLHPLGLRQNAGRLLLLTGFGGGALAVRLSRRRSRLWSRGRCGEQKQQTDEEKTARAWKLAPLKWGELPSSPK